MNKLRIFPLLLALLVLTSCSPSAPAEETDKVPTGTDTAAEEIADTDGYPYTISIEEGEDVIITLPLDPEQFAELHTSDLDGSGTMNRIVLYCVGHGTDVWIEEARVFDGDDGTELPVTPVSEVLAKHLTVTEAEDGWVLSIGGASCRISRSQFAAYPEEEIFDTPDFSNQHDFYVENGQLFCRVSILCAGPGTGYAEEKLLIRYGCEDGAIVPKEITFERAAQEETEGSEELPS